MARTKARDRRGGYTIVEAAISITALALLLSTLLVPLSRNYESRNDEKTAEMLEQIRTAILGYALNNQTQPSFLLVSPANNRLDWVQYGHVPDGRPYLPCPDYDGDGVEDRFPAPTPGINSTITFSTTQPIAATVTLVSTQEVVNTISMQRGGAVSRDLVLGTPGTQFGVCHTDKGFVPWATLGTPPADPYGNRFTYRVDPMFANSVLGIGSETRADVFDSRIPLIRMTVQGIAVDAYQRRSTLYLTHAGGTTPFADDQPTLLCFDSGSNGCTPDLTSSRISGTPVANEIAATSFLAFDSTPTGSAVRMYQRGDIVSAPAFVVVSHGRRAPGAVPHRNGANTVTASMRDTQRFDCLEEAGFPSRYTNRWPEIENVSSVSTCSENIPRVNNLTGTGAQARNHRFVTMIKHDSNESGFDDSLILMSDLEVVNYLTSIGAIDVADVFIPPTMPIP
ncbi:MAG: hypothetical protein ISN26_04010 [Betaproteobacteria bacterium AqS2]|uniref:Type II secretion system protein n=1 Tax=Candidatus Amphirhobacter heronislandensis TaxID=1732024 RepID=A0A930Y1D1_9GAMM|nr:hypothetical protein [Betaproteobacteria bacterium AqS2]